MGYRIKIKSSGNDLAKKTFKDPDSAIEYLAKKAVEWVEKRYIIVPATKKEEMMS